MLNPIDWRCNESPLSVFLFVRVIRFIANRKCAFILFTRLDLHLTIISLSHWITTVLVLLKMIMTDRWGAAHCDRKSRLQNNARKNTDLHYCSKRSTEGIELCHKTNFTKSISK